MNLVTGFLLSYIKYGDQDAILHCFTKEKGYQTYYLRGLYAPKNKKKAFLRPLAHLQFTLQQKTKSSSLENIAKLDLVNNPDFYTNIKANTILFFISDFLNQILRNEIIPGKVYQEIIFFLEELENKNNQSHLVFLLRMINTLGWLPLHQSDGFLDPENGNFISESTHPFFDKEISNLWTSFISEQLSYQIKIPKQLRVQFLDSILIYFHYHFNGFRTPKSLEIVQQIFV